MRIVAGRFRGRQLEAPQRGTRPTTDRTREAIFNLVEARLDLNGTRVLDLFAGSGALGFEALSRGAEHATFVEQSLPALAAIRANADGLDVADRCTIVRADVFRFLGRAGSARFAAAFADPPYGMARIDQLPERVSALLRVGGLFVLEQDRRITVPEHPALDTSRTYGRTVVTLYRATGELRPRAGDERPGGDRG